MRKSSVTSRKFRFFLPFFAKFHACLALLTSFLIDAIICSLINNSLHLGRSKNIGTQQKMQMNRTGIFYVDYIMKQFVSRVTVCNLLHNDSWFVIENIAWKLWQTWTSILMGATVLGNRSVDRDVGIQIENRASCERRGIWRPAFPVGVDPLLEIL